MLGGAWRERSLTLRVLFLLSLALMPLGAISVWQTQRIAGQTVREAEVTLLSVTENAVNPMQAVLQRAFGATRALSQGMIDTLGDPEACIALLARFMQGTSAYSYAAFVQADGMMRCASDGRRFDFSGFPSFAAAKADPRPTVTLTPDAPLSGEPVVIASEPILDAAGAVVGFLSLSIPVRLLDVRERLIPERATPVVTFNAQGQVLTFADPAGTRADPALLLPEGRPLSALSGGADRSFAGPDGAGDERIYAVVAIIPGAAYALSSWPKATIWAGRSLDRVALTSLLPVLMWVASLLVAVLALERLVFRHIRALGRQMRTFARTRRMLMQPMLVDAGTELSGIEADFREMGQAILQDEAALEDALREKNILLKEVHHRVKNNLQLVSSIMNMQARRLTSSEAQDVLRRVQDRVMGLAAVHRSLYQTSDLGRIDAGAVVADLARQIAVNGAARDGVALDLEAAVDEVPIAPDEAVTLSLLVSEAMTNAVDQAAGLAPGDGRAPIFLSLRRRDEGLARLAIRNPRAGGAADPDAAQVDGLGLQLIRAFARQLDGMLDLREEAGGFTLTLDFPTDDRRAPAKDY